jgi:hypothetical protein
VTSWVAEPSIIAVEHQLPALAAAARVDQHRLGLPREHADEPDAKPAGHRSVAALARREQPRQLLIDDRLVHARAGVDDRELEDHRVGVGDRMTLELDLDAIAARVHRVLDQLAQEVVGRLELRNQPLEQRVDFGGGHRPARVCQNSRTSCRSAGASDMRCVLGSSCCA